MSDDSHIVAKRNPHTALGPALCDFSDERTPKGPAPDKLSKRIPELVVEVRSPSNTWTVIFGKVGDTGDTLDLSVTLPGFTRR